MSSTTGDARASRQARDSDDRNPCVIARPVKDELGDGRWQSMHNRYVQEAKQEENEVVFVGDSIVQQLQFSTLWTEKINSLHCFNFGIGGDRVENVLWRIANGEFDFQVGIKAVVVFVGTNNTDCQPEDVFEGICRIVDAIERKLGSKISIIIPTLLPRGQHPNRLRENNARVNDLLMRQFQDSKDFRNVHVVRIHENIIQGDGTISHHVMHDYLHLTDAGYSKIFRPVYDKLRELLGK